MIVLWVFQTFFLESFYTATKSSQVEKNAQVISKSIEENKNALGTIENVASYNSLSVYVYDSTSLFTLKYCCEYDNPVSNLNFQYHDVYSYYKLAEENDGHYMFITSNYKEDSIKGKFERQFFNEYSSSDTAERNTVRYASAPDKNVQNMADKISLIEKRINVIEKEQERQKLIELQKIEAEREIAFRLDPIIFAIDKGRSIFDKNAVAILGLGWGGGFA